MSETLSSTPVALVRDVVPARTTRSVYVDCPHCGGIHVHGWPYGETEVGFRAAHCGRGDYLVGVAK